MPNRLPSRYDRRDLRLISAPETDVHGLVAVCRRGHAVGAIGCAPGKIIEPFDDSATSRLFHMLVADMRAVAQRGAAEQVITFYADLGEELPNDDEVVVYPASRDLTDRLEDNQDPPMRLLQTPYGIVADTDKPLVLWHSVKMHRPPKGAKSVFIHRNGVTYGEGPTLADALSDACGNLSFDAVESLAYLDRDAPAADTKQFYFSII